AIAPVFPLQLQTPKPSPDQKCRAAEPSRTCPDDARSKIAPRLLHPHRAQAAAPRLSALRGCPAHDSRPASLYPRRAAAAQKSAVRAARDPSTKEQTRSRAYQEDRPAPADARSCATNAHPPCSDDRNRAPPANQSRASPAKYP